MIFHPQDYIDRLEDAKSSGASDDQAKQHAGRNIPILDIWEESCDVHRCKDAPPEHENGPVARPDPEKVAGPKP